MAIPATLLEVPNITPYIQYVASSGQTVYPYPFPITQDSDLVVVINGVTLQTDGGYTTQGVGNDTGGTITLTSGSTVGDIVTLYRDVAIERITQIGQNSGFSSTAFNAEFNNIYLILQQLEAQFSQALQIPLTNNPAPTTVLTPAQYAGKYLAFDSHGNPTPALLTSSGAITPAILGGFLYPQTLAESDANIVPSNIYVPSHDQVGYILLQRYGGSAAGISGANDSAMVAALKVSGQCDAPIGITAEPGTWLFSSAWVGAGTSQTLGGIGPCPGTTNATGCRIVGIGPSRPFVKFVTSSIGSTTDCITLGGAQLPQVQVENLQVNFNGNGRHGLVITGSNKPLVRNVMLQYSSQSLFRLFPDADSGEWVEQGEFDLMLYYAGEHAVDIELTGSNGTNPFVNECRWNLDVRGVSQLASGGNAIRVKATPKSGTLGGGAKVSNQKFFEAEMDCIYDGVHHPDGTTGGTIWVPDGSPVKLYGGVVCQTWSFFQPASESTGGVDPDPGGYFFSCNTGGTTGGTVGGILLLPGVTNSFWGNGDGNPIDPLALNVWTFDNSNNQTRLSGAVTVTVPDNTTGMSLVGQTTAGANTEYKATRTGAAVDALGQGAGIQLGNTTSNTFMLLQEYNGQAVLRTFANGGWGERFRVVVDAAGNTSYKLAGGVSFYQGTGGVISNSVGANGDIYFRADGGSMTTIYQRRSGTWTGIV